MELRPVSRPGLRRPRVIAASLATGVRILRFYPNDYFVPFSVNAIGDFAEAMQERRMPLFVDFSSNTSYGQFQTDWEGLIAAGTGRCASQLRRSAL